MPHGIPNSLTGRIFGRLTVVERASNPGEFRQYKWRCRCSCGNTLIVFGAQLTRKDRPTQSCGCLRVERAVESVRTHGMHNTTTYAVWEAIIQRCCNPSNSAFKHYGGRGITICKRWRDSFDAFYADMGERPPMLTIERIDNNLGYSPDNCRWTTRLQQQKNRRSARLITFNGRTETAHMWSKITGIPSRTVINRLNAGWTPERILTTPPRDGFLAKTAE